MAIEDDIKAELDKLRAENAALKGLQTEDILKTRIDLGCGNRKATHQKPDITCPMCRGGKIVAVGCPACKSESPWLGVDKVAQEGVDFVCDIGKDKWPFEDSSVDEARCERYIHRLTVPERIHFANELGRVLKKGHKAFITAPHAFSEEALGDLTACWPPVVGRWYSHLDKGWRTKESPHSNALYTCDFDTTYYYSLHLAMTGWNPERVNHAIQFFKEACKETIATLTKRS